MRRLLLWGKCLAVPVSRALTACIGRPEPEDFPHVRRIGDIIRFHRIKRNTYGPSLRLTELFRSTDKDKGGGGSRYKQAAQGMANKGSNWLTFDGSTVAPLTPRELQAKPDLAFSWTDEDVARLRHLRSWAQSIPELRTNTGATLSDLCSTSNYVDLVARVSHVAQVSEYKALVFVCDGSVPAPKCPLYRAERPPETAAAASTQIHRLEYDRSVMINVSPLACVPLAAELPTHFASCGSVPSFLQVPLLSCTFLHFYSFSC